MDIWIDQVSWACRRGGRKWSMMFPETTPIYRILCVDAHYIKWLYLLKIHFWFVRNLFHTCISLVLLPFCSVWMIIIHQAVSKWLGNRNTSILSWQNFTRKKWGFTKKKRPYFYRMWSISPWQVIDCQLSIALLSFSISRRYVVKKNVNIM